MQTRNATLGEKLELHKPRQCPQPRVGGDDDPGPGHARRREVNCVGGANRNRFWGAVSQPHDIENGNHHVFPARYGDNPSCPTIVQITLYGHSRSSWLKRAGPFLSPRGGDDLGHRDGRRTDWLSRSRGQLQEAGRIGFRRIELHQSGGVPVGHSLRLDLPDLPPESALWMGQRPGQRWTPASRAVPQPSAADPPTRQRHPPS